MPGLFSQTPFFWEIEQKYPCTKARKKDKYFHLEGTLFGNTFACEDELHT